MPNQLPNQQATRTQKRIVDPQAPLVGKPSRTPPGVQQCRECGTVHYHDRWYLKEDAPEEALREEIRETQCPACRQIHDRNPSGVVALSGAFLAQHYDEIIHLIHNENRAAQGINPLERIMEIERERDDCLIITTTNDNLAQRIGRAVHSAYSGDIEFKFAGSDTPVRVNWHRN